VLEAPRQCRGRMNSERVVEYFFGIYNISVSGEGCFQGLTRHIA
jgi:hypothetical protein